MVVFSLFHCICLCYLLFEYLHIEYLSLCNFCKTNRGSKINEPHVPVSPHHPQRGRLEGDGAGIGRIRMREWSSRSQGQLKGNCFQSQQVCVLFLQCSCSRAQAWPENVALVVLCIDGADSSQVVLFLWGEEDSVPCLHWDFIIFSRPPSCAFLHRTIQNPGIILQSSSANCTAPEQCNPRQLPPAL